MIEYPHVSPGILLVARPELAQLEDIYAQSRISSNRFGLVVSPLVSSWQTRDQSPPAKNPLHPLHLGVFLRNSQKEPLQIRYIFGRQSVEQQEEGWEGIPFQKSYKWPFSGFFLGKSQKQKVTKRGV